MIIVCPHCGNKKDKPAGHINRAKAGGYRVFCSRRCSGLARRSGKTKAQLVKEKRLYDIEYRAKNLETITARKAEYHKRTYDPAKAAVIRKKNMPRHIEYCRRPEYRAWKKGYDHVYHATKSYGNFAGVALQLQELETEIEERMTHAEIIQSNAINNKRKRRSRDG
jgi:hypothetical protein